MDALPEQKVRLLGQHGDEAEHEYTQTSCPRWKVVISSPSLIVFLLFCSLLSNIVFIVLYNLSQPQPKPTCEYSKFAGLARHINIPWTHGGPAVLGDVQKNLDSSLPYRPSQDVDRSEYENDEYEDEWPSEASLDIGVIALPSEYARAHELPPGMTFPWDQTKQIYIVSMYHSLHCLTVVRALLRNLPTAPSPKLSPSGKFSPWQVIADLPSAGDIEHALHCMSSLRQDVLCAADDTPRYGGFARGKSGIGQRRMCRDWKELEHWASTHTACYRTEHGQTFGDNSSDDQLSAYRSTHPDANLNGLWHYSWCPEGSQYAEAARSARTEVFGHD